MQADFDVHTHKLFSSLQGNVQVMFSGDEVFSAKTDAGTSSGTDSKETRQTRRILLVEDNQINQKVALRMLKHHGYQADIAINGKEALKALKKESYDLVLMDIQMPVMDGISAARTIRDLFGPEKPYIIAVTANVTEEDRRNCYEAGMNDFISKPIKSDLLAAAIEKAPHPKTMDC